MGTTARRRRRGHPVLPALLLATLVLAGCSGAAEPRSGPTEGEPGAAVADEDADAGGAAITLAFGGDVHFEAGLTGLLDDPDATLGRMSQVLRDADLAMVNLESALTRAGSPTRKELEVPEQRYWFRTPPAALGVMARSGVDVVSVANNHGADFGLPGLRDTLAVAGDSAVGVVGAGNDRAAAFAPYRETIRGTDVAVLAADASMRESVDAIWAAGEGGPGIASARTTPASNLLTAVRAAAAIDDVVVVYLHWGAEGESCPTAAQQELAASLDQAGADVVVGSHTHEVMGSGLVGDTYVSYGLGNFAWYHGRRPDTGVLRLRVSGDGVSDEDWLPARTPLDGGVAVPRVGADRAAAIRRQAERRGCADLAPAPGSLGGEPVAEPEEAPGEDDDAAELPAYAAEVRQIGPWLRDRMSASHDPARCPVTLDDLRHLTVRHVDFGGEARTGQIVVDADAADDVVEVFRDLYRERWPIARMQLVDAYGGDDDASMAANNSSGYNCRVVAGSQNFSDHAYGRAIDLNPIQNPYVTPDGVLPPAGREYADVDRSPGADTARGVIGDQDVVVRAFERVGWEWGDGFADYQHFFVP